MARAERAAGHGLQKDTSSSGGGASGGTGAGTTAAATAATVPRHLPGQQTPNSICLSTAAMTALFERHWV